MPYLARGMMDYFFRQFSPETPVRISIHRFWGAPKPIVHESTAQEAAQKVRWLSRERNTKEITVSIDGFDDINIRGWTGRCGWTH